MMREKIRNAIGGIVYFLSYVFLFCLVLHTIQLCTGICERNTMNKVSDVAYLMSNFQLFACLGEYRLHSKNR